ncbi:hypothetical protein CCR75_001705 [Bremia lactucae]|uniref:Endonuclease/exonuclease/phosphatase domain-containing protein n=1 Tax=Bremia lactucae TaxID=4779 RepID=A0A976FG49_BRELC|nr:hypothetical protein CCR75_001705 [Bremia lactucae]
MAATAESSQRYLVIEATIASLRLFFHVVYAPVSGEARRSFLDRLPDDFPSGCHHLALGDFNIPVDPTLDERSPTRTSTGRDELLAWQTRLRVIDAWRSTHPSCREFTGPGRRNRLDYGFVSSEILEDYLVSIYHVTDTIYHHADHLPVAFTLQSPHHPQRSKLPWKCPTWLLRHPVVTSVLKCTLESMCSRLRTGPNTNVGAVLDEHKRADAIFLRTMFHELKNADNAEDIALTRAVHAASLIDASDGSDILANSLRRAHDALKAHRESIAARCAAKKFDRDASQAPPTSFGHQQPWICGFPSPAPCEMTVPERQTPMKWLNYTGSIGPLQ